MEIISFGEYIEERKFKVLDERVMRASAGIMLILVSIALINGYYLYKYTIIPYISGFLMLNFAIGIFINPKFSPIFALAKLIVWKQTPLYVGAVQKKFAWAIGLVMTISVFIISILLQSDLSFFAPMCILCLICLVLMFAESAFGICIGCKLYLFLLKVKVIPEPEERPNCIGDSCEVE